MELRGYVAVIGKRWVLILSILVMAVAASAGAALLVQPTYQAETQLFVSTQIDAGNLNQALFQGGSFSVDRVKSYTQLATSPKVLDLTIDQLQLQLTAQQLAAKVNASVPLDTVLIQISASDRSPERAAALANSVGASLGQVIEELEAAPNAAGTSPVKAIVVSVAIVPTVPTWPNLTILLVIGLLGGLIVGVGLAMLLESLDTSVKGAADLARVTAAPVLASVSRDGGGSNVAARAIVKSDSRSGRSEAYRQLRTNLQFAAVDEKPGVIVVTSAVPTEGKSSVAGNLALSYAQMGLSVCLVDGDLRRPSVADYFGLVAEVGLTTVLIGRADLDEVLQPVAPDFVAITSGAIPPNPSELLGSERAMTLMRELSERFDMVLIDAPPVLPVADAVVLSAAADGVLYVVHCGRTTRQQVATGLQSLDQVKARVLGVVLNMVPSKGRRSGYGYGYGYTYGYRSTGETTEFVPAEKIGPSNGPSNGSPSGHVTPSESTEPTPAEPVAVLAQQRTVPSPTPRHRPNGGRTHAPRTVTQSKVAD